MSAQKGKYRIYRGLLKAKTELDSKKPNVHIPDLPKA
jgi:hypothetical protein